MAHSCSTVSKYNLLNGKVEEVEKLHPEIALWIEWWHARCSHIFTPFRGAGLPGVNLSEQGYAGWKPRHSIRLVHGAKQDILTMILQEKEMSLLQNSLSKSSGRGPSKAIREYKDKREQMKIAEDFPNMLENDLEIDQEAEEAANPSLFLPNGSAKYKPPKRTKHNTEEDGTKKKARNSRKKTRHLLMMTKLQQIYPWQLRCWACHCMNCRTSKIRPRSKLKQKKRNKIKANPAQVIISSGLGINVCKGCLVNNKEITKDQ